MPNLVMIINSTTPVFPKCTNSLLHNLFVSSFTCFERKHFLALQIPETEEFKHIYIIIISLVETSHSTSTSTFKNPQYFTKTTSPYTIYFDSQNHPS